VTAWEKFDNATTVTAGALFAAGHNEPGISVRYIVREAN